MLVTRKQKVCKRYPKDIDTKLHNVVPRELSQASMISTSKHNSELNSTGISTIKQLCYQTTKMLIKEV